MSNKGFIVDPDLVDLTKVIADIEEIRKYNPQRFDMEQLNAIVFIEKETHRCCGYKDVTNDEFWVQGHMPGMPLMPGVIMCEAAAQLASFYTQRFDLLGAEMVGFGGLEDVRFRGPVVPGDRLFVATELTKLRRGRMIVCRFQGFVDKQIVFDGGLKGIPLPINALQDSLKRESTNSAGDSAE